MANSIISNIRKKRIGRPPVNAIPVMVRIPPAEMEPIDGWISRQDDPPSRPEAIRRLVELGLNADHKAVRDLNEAKSHADKAKKLAAELGLKNKK